MSGLITYEIELDPPTLAATIQAYDEEEAMRLAVMEFRQKLWDGTWSINAVAHD